MPETIKPLSPGCSFADLSQAVSRGMKPELSKIDSLKRGDWVIVLVNYQSQEPGQLPRRDTESISGMVTAKAPGYVTIKILARPSRTDKHNLDFGDLVKVPESAIVRHEPSSAEQLKETEHLLTGVMPPAHVINEDDRKVRQAADKLSSIAPQPGREYWLRNGATVTVWTQRSETTTSCSTCGVSYREELNGHRCPQSGYAHNWAQTTRTVWIGGGEGATLEWLADGRSVISRELDIVKDPNAAEVVA